jgi:flagellar secretion chaperone FliS
MLDPTAAYRSSQVSSASRAGQIVLLYQGAIRFASQHLAFVERQEVEQAHKASIRAQEIVNALRGALDLSAGPIAVQLDQLYDFVLRRLVDGNLTKEARPTEEAIKVLRGLLEAWQEIAAVASSDLVEGSSQPAPTQIPVARPVLAAAGMYAAGGARR